MSQLGIKFTAVEPESPTSYENILHVNEYEVCIMQLQTVGYIDVYKNLGDNFNSRPISNAAFLINPKSYETWANKVIPVIAPSESAEHEIMAEGVELRHMNPMEDRVLLILEMIKTTMIAAGIEIDRVESSENSSCMAVMINDGSAVFLTPVGSNVYVQSQRDGKLALENKFITIYGTDNALTIQAAIDKIIAETYPDETSSSAVMTEASIASEIYARIARSIADQVRPFGMSCEYNIMDYEVTIDDGTWIHFASISDIIYVQPVRHSRSVSGAKFNVGFNITDHHIDRNVRTMLSILYPQQVADKAVLDEAKRLVKKLLQNLN